MHGRAVTLCSAACKRLAQASPVRGELRGTLPSSMGVPRELVELTVLLVPNGTLNLSSEDCSLACARGDNGRGQALDVLKALPVLQEGCCSQTRRHPL